MRSRRIERHQLGFTDRAVVDHDGLAFATRGWGVSVVDETSFGKFLMQGRDAESTLQHLCANDIAVPVGRTVYTGLLNDREAATHWEFEQDFVHRFPDVRLNTNALYVDDDRLITSAGTGAGLDCCLYLVRQHYGSAIANKVARRMVVPPHRDGGQAQFIEQFGTA